MDKATLALVLSGIAIVVSAAVGIAGYRLQRQVASIAKEQRLEEVEARLRADITWNRRFWGFQILAFGDRTYSIDFGSEWKPVFMSVGWCRCTRATWSSPVFENSGSASLPECSLPRANRCRQHYGEPRYRQGGMGLHAAIWRDWCGIDWHLVRRR
jgi:hypothetical protein